MTPRSAIDAQALAMRAVDLTSADEAEALVISSDTALTRFAENRIHQNVAERDTSVSIRAVLDTRTGSASTNRLDDDSLAACAAAAVAAAAASPADPMFPGLPGPRPVMMRENGVEPVGFGPLERAEAVRSIVEQSAIHGLVAAGGVAFDTDTVAVANSHGVDVAAKVSAIRATVLSSGEGAGTGWASHFTPSTVGFDPAAIGDEAATLALRTAGPSDLPPGDYTVVLSPEAVADIVDFLGYVGLSARAYAEGRSFMSEKLGERIVSDAITIVDDALSPESCGLSFDFEGQPKQRVTLIDSGIACTPVTDSYWAARTSLGNTGHALPAPNSIGPLPRDLQMAAGDTTLDALIRSVSKGVFVTRFHYVNVEDPVPVTLTGMTRDGTFLIENGRLTTPLKNLRFTQGAIAALGAVHGVTEERRLFKTMLGSALVPGLLVEKWAFTGQTG